MDKFFKYTGRNVKQAKDGFDRFVSKLKENNHTLLSDYTKSSDKILIDFQCGHEPHWISASKYVQGRGCPYCSKCGKSYGEESLKNAIKENGHELLSDYKSAREKVLIDFKCGHEPYLITPDSYKSCHGCPKCAGHCPEQAKEELFKMIEFNDHELLSDYKSTHKKVLIDFKCGHEPHWISPAHYKNGRSCPKCPDVSQINAKNRFIKKMDECGYTLLTE